MRAPGPRWVRIIRQARPGPWHVAVEWQGARAVVLCDLLVDARWVSQTRDEEPPPDQQRCGSCIRRRRSTRRPARRDTQPGTDLLLI